MKFAKTIVSVFIMASMLLSAVNIVAFADDIVQNQSKAEIKKILKPDDHIECKITTDTEGEYELHITFDTINEATQRIEYAIKVDGKYPFVGAELLEAPVIYEDDGEVRTLSNGDQTAPLQKAVDGYMASAAYDKTGVRLTPYTINLTAGEHTVEIKNIGDAFELAEIAFIKPEINKSYS
ncbi:MAG: hypothetical protein J6D52_05235, partial [Clostridia bacterium]|nr:hypothetical protein [Clostridia bacterium]